MPEGALSGELAVMAMIARDALEQLDVRRPAALIPMLARGLRAARDAHDAVDSAGGDENARHEARVLLAHKIRQYEEALVHASGVAIDAVAQRETLVPGGATVVSARAFVPAGSPVQVQALAVVAGEGWRIEPAEAPAPPAGNIFARLFREQPTRAEHVRLTAPDDSRSTQPYWLETPRRGDVFEWHPSGPKSEPFGLPVARGRATLSVEDLDLVVHVPVQFRTVDRVRGELRRNLHVVPALSVAITPALQIVKVSERSAPRDITVRVESHAPERVDGHVTLDVPAGWALEPAQVPLSIAAEGEGATARFTVRPAAGAAAGAYRVTARAVAGGQVYDERMRVLAYPHVQTHRIYEPAALDVQVIDLDVAPVTLGYIMGVDDEVPDALRLMGVDVTLLTPQDLASGDLSRFHTIMAGIRVSDVRPDFVANIARLHDYVRAGGTLIVQEQHGAYTSRNLAPFQAEIGSRVTDEDAPVTILEPAHPVFMFPNRITQADFEGWVQERNAYGFTTWDSRYTPLLESHDPWDPEQKGGLLYARMGDGHYVYSAYSWFRQLPGGVPGAYRIVANLISLGHAPPVTGQ
jgi:hypothetical protein